MTSSESPNSAKNSDRPTVSVVIATRNRIEECQLAIRSVLNQTWPPDEIVVYDDASTPNMSSHLAEFGSRIRLIRFDSARGATGCRQHAIENCRSTYLLSIDDDCWLSSPEVLESAVEALTSHSGWGAVGLPLVEPLRRPDGHPAFNDMIQKIGRENLILRSFLGGSVLFRIAAIQQIGGVRPAFQMLGGDEADLAWRLQGARWGIGYANCDPVVHTVSPSRDARSKFYYDARSALLCDALNHPFPHVLWSFTRHSIQLFLYQLSFRTLGTRLRGVAAGWWAALRNIGQRQPVPRDIYNRCRALPSHGVECCPKHLRPDLKDSPTPHHPERVNRVIDTREEIKRV